jgi:hypothetical protein
MHFFVQPSPHSGPFLKPNLVFFNDEHSLSSHHYNKKPFAYMMDALTGLSGIKLLWYTKNNFQKPSVEPGLFSAWSYLEALHEVFHRTQPRIQKFIKNQNLQKQNFISSFEIQLKETIKSACQGSEIHIDQFFSLIENISHLEKNLEKPLVFNWELHFSNDTMDLLHTIYSFLYNLRALIAVDHNAHVTDSTFETVRIDSVSDYLPKPEYVLNDALLYNQFQQLAQESKIDSHFIEMMNKSFHRFTHNGYYLVQNLPSEIFQNKNPEELEELLFRTQIDWLLGSHSGLLFKIREELYGVQDGYEKVFWNDHNHNSIQKPTRLEVSCELNSKHFKGHFNAA